MEKNRIIAGIVLYNSDITRLEKVILSIINQVDEVCLFDNGSNNIDDIEKLIYIDDIYNKIKLIKSEKNKGIAYALNQIIAYSENKGYKWVLTLDHDTICPPNMIMEYSMALPLEDVALICPNVIDSQIVKNNWFSASEDRFAEVERCIQTGNLIKIELWKEIGGFDEDLFIDYVDFDYCKRIRINGKKIYRCNNVIVDHEFGCREKTSYAKLMNKIYCFTHIPLFKYLTYKNVFSSIRIYYTFRNNVIYVRKYNRYVDIDKEICSLCKSAIKRVLRSKNRVMVIKQIFNGIHDGILMDVKQYIPKEKDNATS